MAARKPAPAPVNEPGEQPETVPDEQPTIVADENPDVVPDENPEVVADEAAPAPRTTLETAYLDALRRERDGYVAYGREDRVAAVDAELERWGATAEND
jgi:hypothetical protein